MKKWLYERFLPMWAKKTLLNDLQALEVENRRLQEKNREQDAYIRGIHRALRAKEKIQN